MAGIRYFNKKVVLVTGAGSGIGRAIANLFAKEKASLLISDIDENRLKMVEEEIVAFGVPVLAVKADVADENAVQHLAGAVIDRFGRIDVLVNNAGIGWGGPADFFPVQDFKKVMDINFWGVVFGVRAFIDLFKEQGSGHIVNISSCAGINGIPGLSAYTASKYAVFGYTEVLRAELARYGIGVSAICPGIVNTNVVMDGKSIKTDDMKIGHSQMTDFYQKWGWPPEKVAKAVVKAVRKNKGVVPVCPEAWFQWYLKRFSQTLWELYLRLFVRLTF